MKQSLKAFARRFGLDVPDLIDGAQIAELVQQGQWDQVCAHVLADVELTRALARKLGACKAPLQAIDLATVAF
jgi:hypothetical protein